MKMKFEEVIQKFFFFTAANQIGADHLRNSNRILCIYHLLQLQKYPTIYTKTINVQQSLIFTGVEHLQLPLMSNGVWGSQQL